MTLVTVLIVLFPKKAIVPALKSVLMLNSIAMILRTVFGRGPFYMMDSTSMDGTLVAMLWGVANLIPEQKNWTYERYKGLVGSWWGFFGDACTVFLPLIAVVLSKSSMAYGTLAAMFVGYALAQPGKRFIFYSITALILWVGYANLGHMFLDDSGRIQTWKETWTYFEKGMPIETGKDGHLERVWVQQVDQLRGAGTGTYWVHSDWIAHINNRNNHPVFNTLHNDPFEILFEGGWIALTLLALLCLTALARAANRPWLFATVAGICALSFGQMFLRLPFTALCIGLVFKLALSRKENSA
jgi:hypothetical protein